MRGVRGARDDQVVRKRRLLRLGVLVLQAAVAPAVVAAGVAGAVDSERFSERVSERFSERFSESLLLRPLASDLLMAHLNLSMSGDATASLHLFPGPMVELAVGTGATGISLSLTSGRWLEGWGATPAPQPHRMRLRATLPRATADRAWERVRHVLAATLCVSIDELEPEMVSAPIDLQTVAEIEFAPAASAASAIVVRQASAANEGMCTENLAAWLQLSPCRDAAGLGALLTPGAPFRKRLRAARLNALHLHLDSTCDGQDRTEEAGVGVGCARPRLQQQLALTAVIDGGPSSWDVSAAPPREPLEFLFGTGAPPSDGLHACPLATASQIALELPRRMEIAATPMPCANDLCVEVVPPPERTEVEAQSVWPSWRRVYWRLKTDQPLRISLRLSSDPTPSDASFSNGTFFDDTFSDGAPSILGEGGGASGGGSGGGRCRPR